MRRRNSADMKTAQTGWQTLDSAGTDTKTARA